MPFGKSAIRRGYGARSVKSTENGTANIAPEPSAPTFPTSPCPKDRMREFTSKRWEVWKSSVTAMGKDVGVEEALHEQRVRMLVECGVSLDWIEERSLDDPFMGISDREDVIMKLFGCRVKRNTSASKDVFDSKWLKSTNDFIGRTMHRNCPNKSAVNVDSILETVV